MHMLVENIRQMDSNKMTKNHGLQPNKFKTIPILGKHEKKMKKKNEKKWKKRTIITNLLQIIINGLNEIFNKIVERKIEIIAWMESNDK